MALTDVKIMVLEKETANRVVVQILDPEMAAYVEEHPLYIYSKRTDEPLRLEPKKPIDVDLVPEVIRMIQRAADDMVGGRTMRNLATPAQISRARELAKILNKRKDNAIFLPSEVEKMTLGQVGRLIHDYKVVLIDEGLWDDEKKCEIVKEVR